MCPGVVVIDDQPEVSIDDPAFLFESNEGFQEVTSKKAQKVKQKAAAEEAMKKVHDAKKKEAVVSTKVKLVCVFISFGVCYSSSF